LRGRGVYICLYLKFFKQHVELKKEASLKKKRNPNTSWQTPIFHQCSG
jgi:hypothetical protein